MKDKHVFIIDDDPQVTSVLSKLFSDKGAQVTTVATLAAAKEGLKASMPDIVIVDVLLPDGSGLDLIKEESARQGAHPFFVVLTNSVNAQHIAEAMTAKVPMFVQKADNDPREIVEMIQKRLERGEKPNTTS